ncbi:PIN-like domain-containing protein [Streptococcus pluranimalium]|uniref:PIN-like domain-containing protein n=1 Tax=Streptococcus pluranimalium TaxID=82348 RepID=UPI00292F5685|nr:PIN-like domain-containing protein [Streptococcus pluranimalium]
MNIIKLTKEHYTLTREPIDREKFKQEIFAKAKIVFDNNALLDPLRIYTHNDKIFSTLEKLSNQTYIPYITQIEYMNKEEDVIQKSYKIISDSKAVIDRMRRQHNLISKTDIKNQITKKLLETRDKKFTQNISIEELFEKTDEYNKCIISELEKTVDSVVETLKNRIKESQKKINNDFDWGDVYQDKYDETVQSRLHDWLDSTTLGEKYSMDELAMYISMIKKRYQAKVSPGYEDEQNKNGKFIQLGNIYMNKSFSDALFWLDVLNWLKVQKDSDSGLEYLIIISNETKLDWVEDNKAYKLKRDMINECYGETGMFPVKLSFKDLLALLSDMSEEELESVEKQLEAKYSFDLYGQHVSCKTQNAMMIAIFDKVFKKVDGHKFVELPCIELRKDVTNNTIFTNKVTLTDKSNSEYILGLTLNLRDKFRYIYQLLELRHPDSASQLKFLDENIQKDWKELCQKSKYKKS